MTSPRANLAVQQVLAAARLFTEAGFPQQARALRDVVCDYQETAAKRHYEERTA